MFKLVPIESTLAENSDLVEKKSVNIEEIIKKLKPHLQKKARNFMQTFGSNIPFDILPDHRLSFDGVITSSRLEDFLDFLLSSTTHNRPLALGDFIQIIRPFRKELTPLLPVNKKVVCILFKFLSYKTLKSHFFYLSRVFALKLHVFLVVLTP